MSFVKSTGQKILKRTHLYQRLKGSALYDLFWKFADKQIVEQKNAEIAFYRDLLRGFRPGDRIFDVGANEGYKTEIFLRLGARVVAVDPDRTNQNILKEKFLTYRLIKKPVSIVAKAVSDKQGSQTFWIDEPGSGKNTLNQKWVDILRVDKVKFGKRLEFRENASVETVTLEHLITRYGSPFFVKIDVEGHEAAVLQGLESRVPYLSFEVNLPEFKQEGLQCLEILQRIDPSGSFNYTIDSRTKLVLENWTGAKEFGQILQQSEEKSLDVFWRTVR